MTYDMDLTDARIQISKEVMLSIQMFEKTVILINLKREQCNLLLN